MIKQTFFNFIVLIAALSIMTSCNSESLNDFTSIPDSRGSSVEILGTIVDIEDNKLSFKDENELQSLLSKITDNNIQSTRQSVDFMYLINSKNSFKSEGFISLYDVYEEALSVAESYYEREGGYEEFKEKYSCLYFPEYKNDYSAYLPVNDKDLAKLLTPNGELIIGGRLTNLNNIDAYEQLQELGWGIPDIDNHDYDKSESALSSLSTKATKTVILKAGKSYEENKKKIWVDIKTYAPNLNPPSTCRFDVCFRKKGFLGAWYNHDAITDFFLRCTSDTYGPYQFRDGRIGYSSHDYTFLVQAGLNKPVRNMKGTIEVTYDAIPNTWFVLNFDNANTGIPG